VLRGKMVHIALVVGNSGALTAKETAIKAKVERWGWLVDVKDDGLAADSWDPETYDGVIISQSVTSGNVTWMCDEAVGFLNYENGLMDDFDMGTGSGAIANQTDINIVDNTHYITRHYPTGNITVTAASGWIYWSGWANDVNDLGQQVGQATRACLLEVDKGETLVGGGAAPERRVGWLIGAGTGNDIFNTDGWHLFFRALKWVCHQDFLELHRLKGRGGDARSRTRFRRRLCLPDRER